MRPSISRCEGGVGEHEGVGAEDGAVLGAELGVDGLLRLAGFAGGGFEGLAERGDFVLDLVRLDEALGNAEPFGVQHQGRTDGDAGRDGDSAFDFHARARRSSALVRKRFQTGAALRQGTSLRSRGLEPLQNGSRLFFFLEAALPAGRRKASVEGLAASGPVDLDGQFRPLGAASIIRSSMLLPLTTRSVRSDT